MLNTYIIFILLGVYLVLIGIIYFLIYHKHHKRNEVKLDELVELLTKFFSLTTLSLLMIIFGFYLIAKVAIYRYDYNTKEILATFLLGVFIISATVINYIKYIKNSLKDLDLEIKEEVRKKNFKIGEIVELIMFSILILLPVLKVPIFYKLKEYKNDFYLEIIKTFAISIASLFILYNLNPLDIKNKIFKSKKNKNVDINEKK